MQSALFGLLQPVGFHRVRATLATWDLWCLILQTPQMSWTDRLLLVTQVIPADLRPIVGRRKEKVSLKTKNPGEAQKLHARKAAEIAEKWARLRGNASLDHVDIRALAGEYFRQTVASKHRNPGEARQYVEQLKKNFFAHIPPVRFNGNALVQRRVAYGAEARQFLADKGYRLDDASLDKFLKAFGDAVRMAAEQLLQITEGDYSPHAEETKFQKFEPRKIGPELDLWETWEKYSPRLKAHVIIIGNTPTQAASSPNFSRPGSRIRSTPCNTEMRNRSPIQTTAGACPATR
jgi:hypothetical protein